MAPCIHRGLSFYPASQGWSTRECDNGELIRTPRLKAEIVNP
jgi:hypothetical protein